MHELKEGVRHLGNTQVARAHRDKHHIRQTSIRISLQYIHKKSVLPSSSFRVRLAISLISMRDSESECVAEMRGVGATMVGPGVVSTLLTRGDLRGLSMLRPTKLHRGILNMCLHADSPGTRKKWMERRRRERRVKSER